MNTDKEKFHVCCIEESTEEEINKPRHWADNLEMEITKGECTIKLNSEEIQQIVKSLPNTFGGIY